MKKHITLGLVVGTLFAAGCCTSHHATAWEYKIVSGHLAASPPFVTSKQPSLGDKISQAATEGWQVVSTGTEDNTPFVIMRRPK
jgi:hypothetical protein